MESEREEGKKVREGMERGRHEGNKDKDYGGGSIG